MDPLVGRHRLGDPDRRVARLDAEAAAQVASTLHALANPSRLLILTELRHGPRPVTALAEAVGVELSVVSHQLRLLRDLDLVTGVRAGRSIVYSLTDEHVAHLLDRAVHHSTHLHRGRLDKPPSGHASTHGRFRR